MLFRSAFLPIPLILVGAFWFQKKLAPRYAAAREAAATVSDRLNNNLAGIATIKAYTAEAQELERVRAVSDGYRARNAEAQARDPGFSGWAPPARHSLAL